MFSPHGPIKVTLLPTDPRQRGFAVGGDVNPDGSSDADSPRSEYDWDVGDSPKKSAAAVPATQPRHAHGRAPATVRDIVRMHEEAERQQHLRESKALVKSVTTTQYTDIPERRALKQLMKREAARFKAEMRTHLLLLQKIADRMLTYHDGTNSVHQKLRAIHHSLSGSLSQFGIPNDFLAERYESLAMHKVHELLSTEIRQALHNKQMAITAMRIAKRGVGTTFDDAAAQYNRIPAGSDDFVGRHKAAREALEAAKTLMAGIREAQDQAYEVMALDHVTNTWLADTLDQEQLHGLRVDRELELVKRVGREALERMQSHQALRAKVDSDVGGWTASHFDRVDPKFLSHIRELKEEKLREQAEAQKLLAEAANLGARRSTP